MSGPWEKYASAASTGPWAKYAAAPVEEGPSVGDRINTGVDWLGTQITKAGTGLAGLPADLQALGQKGADYVLSKATGQDFNTPAPTMPGSADLNKAVFQGLGVPEVNAADNPAFTLKPPGTDAKINVGKFLDLIPQAAAGGGLIGGGKAVVPTITSGIASEAAGQATAGTPYEIPARLLAAVPGQMIGNRLQTPLPANLTPEEQRLVALSQNLKTPQGESIPMPLSVGQETGRLRGLESGLERFPSGAGQFKNLRDAEAQGIQRAALGEMNAPPGLTRTDPQSMAQAYGTASAEFNAAKNAIGPVSLDQLFYQKINKTLGDYLQNVAPSNAVPAVQNRVRDFYNPALAGNQMSGPQYQEYRRAINTAAEGSKDPTARNALKDIRTALDDAAQASATPEAAQAFADARKHYGAYKTISKAAASAGPEAQAKGNLSPGGLSTALRQWQGPDQYARTTGGLNDIARVSKYLADTVPNSGTPTTWGWQHILLGGGPGAIPGAIIGGAPGAAIGAATSIATPNLLARALTGSKGFGWLRDYLANQTGAKTSQAERLAQALMGAEAAR